MMAVLDRPTTTWGPALRRLRLRTGKTQRRIGEEIGLTEAGYRHYESGISRPSVDSFPVLARAYGISVDELMEVLGVTEPSAPEDLPTIDMIVRSIRRSPELSEDDKDLLARLVERSRRIARGEPDPYPDD